MFEINSEVVSSSSISSSKILKGGQIHKVKLIDVKEEVVDIKERKESGDKAFRAAYKDTVLVITVANAEGETFTEKYFTPTEEAFKPRNSNAGKPQPTFFQQTQNKITQFLLAFRPTFMEEVKNGTKTFKASDWASFRKLVVKHLTPAINKNGVFFKLLKNKSGYAEVPPFPAAMAMDKDTNQPRIFTGSVFIHHDESAVFISEFEQKGLDALKNAKPSNASSFTKEGDDEDLGVLDAEDLDIGDLDMDDDDLPL